MITLRKVDRSNWHETLLLAVQPDQQKFISDYAPIAAIALAKAYVGAVGLSWVPYAIYAEQQNVGFFALAFSANSQEDIWLFHFFIDQRFQRRGYGKAALSEIIRLVQQIYPDRTGISLLVHPENTVAQALYQNSGFRLTKEELWGEPVYRLKFGQDGA